jgi:hypothetical protein
MNLIELDRALRQLRMSGMANTLETRLLQAQTDAMAHIDLVSMLVSDEIECRSKRLLERMRLSNALCYSAGFSGALEP